MIRLFCKIDFCASAHVHALPVDKHTVIITDYAPWHNIPIVDTVIVKSEDVYDGVWRCSTSMSVILPSRPKLPSGPLVFRLTDTNGVAYLLGIPVLGSPYPEIRISDYVGRPADTESCKLEAVLKSDYPLAQIL